MGFTVTEKAMRLASPERRCFYCQKDIGEYHKDDCVLIQRKVRVKMTISYEITDPSSWDVDNIEFYRNEGSWCADNAIDELKKLAEESGCLCGTDIKFEYVDGLTNEPFLDE